jgi:hypothetical protein
MTNKFFCDDGIGHDWTHIGIDGDTIVYMCLKCDKCKK